MSIKQTIHELDQKGCTQAEIAALLEVSRQVVWYHLVGCKNRKTYPASDATRRRARDGMRRLRKERRAAAIMA